MNIALAVLALAFFAAALVTAGVYVFAGSGGALIAAGVFVFGAAIRLQRVIVPHG